MRGASNYVRSSCSQWTLSMARSGVHSHSGHSVWLGQEFILTVDTQYG